MGVFGQSCGSSINNCGQLLNCGKAKAHADGPGATLEMSDEEVKRIAYLKDIEAKAAQADKAQNLVSAQPSGSHRSVRQSLSNGI